MSKQAQENQVYPWDDLPVQSLFRQEYHNIGIVEPLCKFTENAAKSYTPESRIYSPYFSFLQSSGMGRTAHLVLYCCVRKKGSTGFPLATQSPKYFAGWNERDWALYLCASVRCMSKTWADLKVKDRKGWMDYHILDNTFLGQGISARHSMVFE